RRQAGEFKNFSAASRRISRFFWTALIFWFFSIKGKEHYIYRTEYSPQRIQTIALGLTIKLSCPAE
ncbi:MAG: hypothetical protein AB7W47_16745, partial [Calditrichaceae bacterium]